MCQFLSKLKLSELKVNFNLKLKLKPYLLFSNFIFIEVSMMLGKSCPATSGTLWKVGFLKIILEELKGFGGAFRFLGM